MAEATCSICKGEGRIEIVEDEEIRYRSCVCSYVRSLKEHIVRWGERDLAEAPTLTDGALYQMSPDPGEPPLIDRTKDNLFIKGDWKNVKAHIKWALVCKGPSFQFSVVTDEFLKQVYVGNEHKRNKKNTEEIWYNSLRDVVGKGKALVIIRLGHLGWKNVAMAGLLREALKIRESCVLPTWILEDDPEVPYLPGHLAWSSEMAGLISRNYETLDLSSGAVETPVPPPQRAPANELGVPEEALTMKEEIPPDEPIEPVGSLDNDRALFGSSSRKTSKYKGRTH